MTRDRITDALTLAWAAGAVATFVVWCFDLASPRPLGLATVALAAVILIRDHADANHQGDK